MDGRDDVDFLGAVRRRWKLLLVVTVICAALGFVYSETSPRVYEGSASLLVGEFGGDNVSNNDVQASQALAALYADVARREPILGPVAAQLGYQNWHTLLRQTHVRVPRESPQVIEITVDGRRPGLVKDAAGEIANGLMKYAADRNSGGHNFIQPQITRLEQSIEATDARVQALTKQRDASTSPTEQADLQKQIDDLQQEISSLRGNYVDFKALLPSSSNVVVRKLDPAYASNDPISPDVKYNTVIAGFVGLVLALAVLYLIEARRRRPDPSADRVVRMPLIPPPAPQPLKWPPNGQGASLPGSAKPRAVDPRRP